MKKITVLYWHSKIAHCKYGHMESFEYSDEKRSEILDYLYSLGLSAMIRPEVDEGGIIIWVDKGRFGQR